NERHILEAVGHHHCIRPIIDTTDEPHSLILKYLDDNLLRASNTKKLEKADIKYVARNLLQALEALHSRGYVHTDVKPDNVLVNYGTAPDRFSEVQLGDCGDTFMLISLIWGSNWHIFKPTEVPFESEEYPLQVLIKQVSIFGPVPISYGEISDDERLGILTAVINLINEHKLHKPFALSDDKELSAEDRNFICKIMRLDPRDRPTAKELLQDEWFQQE
ncbi:MAG: hypothetical protein Q9187_009376, partial [Circinaria calcarea]